MEFLGITEEKTVNLRIGKKKCTRPLTALPKESKRRNKLSLVPNLTSNNFFPRNQEESVRKARNAKRAYLMSAGKERPSINSGFVRLGSKVEKEKGQIHEDNLSKSIQNLRMRSTYSSGFGISTPSFMVSQKKTPCTKLRKYSPNAKNLTKHRQDTNRTRESNSLVVFQDPELASKASIEKEIHVININSNSENQTMEENHEQQSVENELRLWSKSSCKIKKMKTISLNSNSVESLKPHNLKKNSRAKSKEQNNIHCLQILKDSGTPNRL